MKLLLSGTIVFASLGALNTASYAAKTPLSPEKEAAYLGRILKPISDEAWQGIAGPRVTEKYSITKGDTLFDISKKLFGDAKYWPKIWALNNSTVLNPHWIKPGFIIAFQAGSGGSLPSLSVSDSKTDVSTTPPLKTAADRHTEWRDLPIQSWEVFNIPTLAQVDPLGFDLSNKIVIHRANGFDPLATPSSEEIPFLGQIIGSRSESVYLGMNDLVYIQADEKLQVGETYTITRNPMVLKSKKSDRTGYSYLQIGKVKITGIRDHVFIGRILTNRDYLPRGSFLIPNIPRVPELTPIAGPRPIPGVLMLDHSFSTYATAQHKEVFIDRGSEDGIQPGMVFRAYEHKDPSNDKKISNSNFVIDADFIVIQVSPTFCSALAIHSLSPVIENSPVVLLTDISDLNKNDGFSNKGADDDDLDKLDENDGMTAAERRELKQLEKWKKNPENATSATPTPSPNPSPEPTPSDTPTPEASAAPEPAPTATPAPSAEPSPATSAPADTAPPTAEPAPPTTEAPAPETPAPTPESAPATTGSAPPTTPSSASPVAPPAEPAPVEATAPPADASLPPPLPD
jgi:hypothetical protein